MKTKKFIYKYHITFKDFVIHIYKIRHLYVQLRAELYQLENCLGVQSYLFVRGLSHLAPRKTCATCELYLDRLKYHVIG